MKKSDKDSAAHHELQDILVEQRNEARDWAIRRTRERDTLQAEARVKRQVYRFYQRDADQLREKVKELEAELDALKAELADEGVEERRCGTCRRQGLYGCDGLRISGEHCVANGFEYWEPRIPKESCETCEAFVDGRCIYFGLNGVNVCRSHGGKHWEAKP